MTAVRLSGVLRDSSGPASPLALSTSAMTAELWDERSQLYFTSSIVMARPLVGGRESKLWFCLNLSEICRPSGEISQDSKASPVMALGEGILPIALPAFSGVL